MKLGIPLVLLILCLGCSDPHDYKIPSDSDQWKEDKDLKSAVDKLVDEEKQLLARWMLRAGMAETFGQEIPDHNIREALADQRKFEAAKAAKEAEEKALAERIRKEREEVIAKMNSILTVAVTEIGYHEADWRKGIQDGFTIRVALKNKSGKNLAGVKGSIRFADMFNDEIKVIGLSIDEQIPANKAIIWVGESGYNQFMDSDKKLRSTLLQKLKITWDPEIYLFQDGSKLEQPK